MTRQTTSPVERTLHLVAALAVLGITTLSPASGPMPTLSRPAQAETMPAELSERALGDTPLGLGKTPIEDDPLCPGGTIEYVVTIENNGFEPGIAEIRDPIPPDTTLSGPIDGGSLEGNQVVWRGYLIPGTSHTVSFPVQVDSDVLDGTEIENVATGLLLDESGEVPLADNLVAVSSTVDCSGGPPDEPLEVDLDKRSAHPLPLTPGSVIEYTLELTNPSSNGQTVDGSLEDAIPAGTTFVAGSLETEGSGTSATTRTSNGEVVSIEWSGPLDPGQTVTVRFAVRVDDDVFNETGIVNTGRGTLSDPLGERQDGVDEMTIEDRVDRELEIEVEKTAVPGVPVCPGDVIRYTITLTNPRVNNKTLNAAITDPLHRRVSFHRFVSSTRPGVKLMGATVEWSGTLAPGDSQEIVFEVEVDSGAPAGTVIPNVAYGVLSARDERDRVTGQGAAENRVADCDLSACPVAVSGFVEDAVGNGQGRRYPVSNARVWLVDLGSRPLPAPPLSERTLGTLAEGRTDRTFETDLEDEAFPAPGRAGFAFDLATIAPPRCPPRTAVVSFLWDADDRFAVAPASHVGGRYVPAYLARCISDDPDEVMPAGPCLEWRLSGGTFVPWDPVRNAPAEIGFTWGRSPDNLESTRVIHDPATSAPPLSEAWNLGPALPPDAFFRDAAHMHFFTYKGMETLSALAAQVRTALEDLTGDGEETKTVPLAPALVTPHDRDCPAGCAWPAPQLSDDPLTPLPHRLPLDFGGLRPGAPTVSAGTLVAFGPDHSGALSFAAGQPDPGDKPDNREWHELGHHWMLQLYGGDWPGGHRNDSSDCRDAPLSVPPIPAGHGNGNHCGYANLDTTDSTIEGFAELTSMVIAASYGDRRPYLYHLRGNDQNLEVDHQVWGPYTVDRGEQAASEDGEATALELLDPRDEDFAVAGILWDLLDGGTAEAKATGTASDAIGTEDRIDQSPAVVFAHVRDRRPGTLSALHATFSDAFPGDTDGDGFTDVDEIFIAHGAFGDSERDLRHDDGEVVGGTGSSSLPVRPVRPSREPVPNGYLDIGFRADGFPFAPFGFPLELEYRFDPPFDHYDWDRTIRSRPHLHLHMPPPVYPCRVTITARGKDDFTGYRSEPLTVTCSEYWSTVGSGAPSLGRHTFVLEERETPDPYAGPWLTSPELPGFEAKVRITPRGGSAVEGSAEPTCIVETLCVSGALEGRPEIFVKVIGPRPNGKLWTQIARFTPSEVEVWLRQVATGSVRYYRLGSVGAASEDVFGIQDREAFDPAVGSSAGFGSGSGFGSSGGILPGAAVEPLPPATVLGPRLGPGEPEPPAGIAWLSTPELPGFRLKARITPAGGEEIGGQGVERCIPETLCIAGALAGRPEVFAKIIGPRPNGFLWAQGARFTPSGVELWVEQTATGEVRYYRLAPVPRGSDEVSGLQDREAFSP